MRVAVVGCAGVPGRYGGFETLAEQLARHLKADEISLSIYCDKSLYTEKERQNKNFFGHKRIFLPIKANSLSSIFYDIVCILHALLVEKVDRLLVLGYSGAICFAGIRLLFPKAQIIVNVDGMEWRRDKWSKPAKTFLKASEYLATKFAHSVIADNPAIAYLLKRRYDIDPITIAYGGDHTLKAQITSSNEIPKDDFYLTICRIEPENNCHLILEACAKTGSSLVFIGNWDASSYGRKLKALYSQFHNILTLNPIYEINMLAAYRKRAVGYIHGHSIGGTNPSLVEALYWTDKIFAFDCQFNRETLFGFGKYFSSVETLIENLSANERSTLSAEEVVILRASYTWQNITSQYSSLFFGAATEGNNNIDDVYVPISKKAIPTELRENFQRKNNATVSLKKLSTEHKESASFTSKNLSTPVDDT